MNGIIKIDDSKYPRLLKSIGKNAPKQLYYKGEWQDDIFENCLAVVGSRRMTTYGRQIAEKLVSEIASRGITIVSGFMYGIDATAHKATIGVGGKTIAVMPCGIDLVHPEYQIKLYSDILEAGGLIISEYGGDTNPALWTYPARNRIVAGLSKAVMVIEAGEKSGSLITANLAENFERKVFAVPGPLTSVLSTGVMQLIKKGAEAVGGSKDVLDFFGRVGVRQNGIGQFSFNSAGSSTEQRIIQELQKEPMEIDFLVRELNISVSEINKVLSLMEINGQIVKDNNKYYVH